MRLIVSLVLVLFVSLPAAAADPVMSACEGKAEKALVQCVKSNLEQRGQTWRTNEDAFEIVRRVACLTPGARFIAKQPAQNGATFDGRRFSHDVIGVVTAPWRDLLQDAGPPNNLNAPTWNEVHEGREQPTVDPFGCEGYDVRAELALRTAVANELCRMRSSDDPEYWVRVMKDHISNRYTSDWSYWVGRIEVGDGVGKGSACVDPPQPGPEPQPEPTPVDDEELVRRIAELEARIEELTATLNGFADTLVGTVQPEIQRLRDDVFGSVEANCYAHGGDGCGLAGKVNLIYRTMPVKCRSVFGLPCHLDADPARQ